MQKTVPTKGRHWHDALPEELSGRHMKYNPAFLTLEEIVDHFCVRQREFSSIIDIIKKNNLSANRHVLVIGPRGSGKTTLMHRICAEISFNQDLSAHWFPIICSEELYEAISLEDFWLEILFHASRQNGTSREKLHSLYEELKQNHKNDPNLGPIALSKLLEFSDVMGKRLLIICENVNQMFGGSMGDKEAWGLRRIMQNEPRIMFAATATQSFGQMEGKDKPFFDIFTIFELARLNPEECRILWSRVSGYSIPLSQARALQVLTGGLPRLLTLLANFGKDLSFLNLMNGLEQLIDNHTEYFKSSIEALPAKERKVFVSLATLWQNSSAAQVAQGARMDVRETSALLNRLVGRGIVREYTASATGFKKQPKTYQLTERLFNIYYLMRRGDYSHFVKDFIRFIAQVFQEDFLHAVEGFRKLKRGELTLKQQVHYDSCMSVIGEFNSEKRETKKTNAMIRISEQGLRLCKEGNWFEAAGAFREALKISSKELGAQHPNTLMNMNNLGIALDNLGFFTEAENLHRHTLEVRREFLGIFHNSTLESQNNLAASLNHLGQLEEARELHKTTLKARLRTLGKEHPDTLVSINNLASTLERLGDWDQAQRLHEQTLEIRRRTLGDEHPDTLASMNNLGNTLDDKGLLEDAATLHKKTLSTRVRVLGALHPSTLISRNNLANTLGRMNHLYEAEVLHRHTLKSRIQILGEEHPDTLVSMNNLGVTLGNQGRMDEAELLHRQSLEKRKKTLGDQHPDTLLSMNDLASALIDRRRPRDEKREMEAQTLIQLVVNHPQAPHFIRILTDTLVQFCALSEKKGPECIEILETSSHAGIWASLIAGIRKYLNAPFQAPIEMREIADDIAQWIQRSQPTRETNQGERLSS